MEFENTFVVKLEKYYKDDSSFNRWDYVISYYSYFSVIIPRW